MKDIEELRAACNAGEDLTPVEICFVEHHLIERIIAEVEFIRRPDEPDETVLWHTWKMLMVTLIGHEANLSNYLDALKKKEEQKGFDFELSQEEKTKH